MSHPNEISSKNPNEANIDDLQKRAQSQFLYLLIGAAVTLITGASVLATQWANLQLQHIILIAAATAIGMAIMLISAVDMKANVRGYHRYRDEQQTMERLSEKYRNPPSPGKSPMPAESDTSQPNKAEPGEKWSNPKSG